MSNSLAMSRFSNEQVTELHLPLVDRTSLPRQNHLARPRRHVTLESGAGSISFAPAPDTFLGRWAGSWARIDVVISDRLAELSVPIDIMLRIAGDRFPELPYDTVDPRLRATIAEFILAPLIKAVEGVMQAPVRFGEVHCPTSAGGSVDFTFDVRFGGSEPFPVAIRCSPVDRAVIGGLLNRMEPVRTIIPDLTIPVSMRAGYTTVTLTEMAALSVGSGIILDGTYLTFQKITAVTGERFVQTCTWQSLKPILDGPILRPLDAATRPFTTGSLMSDGVSDNEAPFGTVKDVPVHLVFELGRLSINVNDLETLAQGFVFDLGRPLSQSVDILSGGRRIGTGELVRIADSIGVRVTRIAT
jgi:type III secretion protein Q